MALQITYQVQPGISGNHWEIFQTSVSRDVSIFFIQVKLWTDSTSAENKDYPIFTRTYSFTGSEYQSLILQIKGPPAVNANDVMEDHLIANYSEWSGATKVSDSWPG